MHGGTSGCLKLHEISRLRDGTYQPTGSRPRISSEINLGLGSISDGSTALTQAPKPQLQASSGDTSPLG